jgi:hypothetical protein
MPKLLVALLIGADLGCGFVGLCFIIVCLLFKELPVFALLGLLALFSVPFIIGFFFVWITWEIRKPEDNEYTRGVKND